MKTKKLKFIVADTFDMASLDGTAYETIGVVYARHGREVKFVYKQNEGKVWADKIVVELQGYNLDGQQHSGTISYIETSSSAANTDLTVTYTANTLQQLADRLNTVFASQPVMVTQKWHAYISEGKLLISYDYNFWQQGTKNIAKDGFTFNKDYYFKDIPYYCSIRRKNGFSGGDGAVVSMPVAMKYYGTSTGASDSSGNVGQDMDSLENRQHPVNKTSYLGKSADGLDHCAGLRKKYGEGEQGWLNCLKTFKPVCPTDTGNFGEHNGHALTRAIASYKDQNGHSIAPAADYCLSVSTAVLPAGSFYLPTVEDLSNLMAVIKYGTSPIDDCPINSMLQKMNGTTVANTSYWWSCCRVYWFN
ncbi:hypothetical protein EVA_02712, partial [gut metagenome]